MTEWQLFKMYVA